MTADTPSPGPEIAPVVEASTKACSASPAPIEESVRRFRLLPLSLLALIVGVTMGFGAVVFRGLIGLIHNLFFLGQFLFTYDSSVFTPIDPWGAAIILVPVIGGIGVTWIVSNFAPEAKGMASPK
jgi:CIC family chloride channel protein